MKKLLITLSLTIIFIAIVSTQSIANENITSSKSWISAYTNKDNSFPTWEITNSKSDNISEYIFKLISTNAHGGIFNLCYTKNIQFKNGTIEVLLKANDGFEDQGGGVVWRVQDKNNYYITRYNPLEDNICIYYVKDGHRKILDEKTILLKNKQWHSIKVVQDNNQYKIYLDSQMVLDGYDDRFKSRGGVGVWTKADALSSFKDFKVITKN